MPRHQRSHSCRPRGSPPLQREVQGLVDGQVLKPEEEKVLEEGAAANASAANAGGADARTTAASATCAGASLYSFPSPEVPIAVTPDCVQNPRRVLHSPTAMASTQRSQFDEGSHSQQEAVLLPTRGLQEFLDNMMHNLVEFLLFKYQIRMPATKTEMLYFVVQNYEAYFHVLFQGASKSMYVVFGIEVKEVPPPGQTYVLVPALGLTYDGMLSDVQTIPKTSLLIIVLGVIFMQANHAREEALWEVLSRADVWPGVEHFMFGEPGKLIKEFVQEGYLECWQLPGDGSVQYEFRWGLRAYAETNPKNVMDFIALIDWHNPWSYPSVLLGASHGGASQGP
ncbi:melanoma-associated antigen 11-like [Ctenodactylus gundi]